MKRSSTCTWISQLTSWPSVKKQNGIDTSAIVTSDTSGKCLVGCTRAKMRKKSPSRAAAYGMRE